MLDEREDIDRGFLMASESKRRAIKKRKDAQEDFDRRLEAIEKHLAEEGKSK